MSVRIPMFRIWAIKEDRWQVVMAEPLQEGMASLVYTQYSSGEPDEATVWRKHVCDGQDNPGVQSQRVTVDELPDELVLTLNLMEIPL